jgi:acyl-CoA dehydrogenase
MSEQRQMLADSVTRLFETHASAAADAQVRGWQQALWEEIDALGIVDILVPEASGGSGADWDDACAVLHASGRWQIPLPLAEAMIARKLLAESGLPAPRSTVGLSPYGDGELSLTGDGWQFSGTLRGVPWGRDVEQVVTTLTADRQCHVVILQVADARIHRAANLAAEPRDELRFAATPALAAPATSREAQHLLDYAALARSAQIAGALESALERSIAYALERKQFGRPIGQFQAVQQQLALFGAETAAAACAVRSAGIAASTGDAWFQIAAAKLRANLAIGVGTATAHQVHGAIGFTSEYALRHATQRLWSWRSEFGNDRYWSERLGAAVIARGAENFWADLTQREDRMSE